MDLTTKFDGLTLKNPLMPAAGPLVGDPEKMLWLKEQGLGAIVAKTICPKDARIPHPCIYGEQNFIMNCELWSEYPMRKWIDEFLPYYHARKGDTPLFISVGYTKEDMEILIPQLDKYADAFEVSTHYVGNDLNALGEVVRTIRKHTKKPIFMKISPHMPDPAGFARTIKENGANGVTAINSLGPAMRVDIDKRGVKLGNDKGLVWESGPAIKAIALATVYTIKKTEPSLTVIGAGGVASADDVIEFLLAGASAVEMLSSAMLRGKDLYAKIIKDLPAALARHGFKSVQEVIDTELKIGPSYEPGPTPYLVPGKCIRCGLCVKICPYFAITLTDTVHFDPAKCFRCALCVSRCPVKAIRFHE